MRSQNVVLAAVIGAMVGAIGCDKKAPVVTPTEAQKEPAKDKPPSGTEPKVEPPKEAKVEPTEAKVEPTEAKAEPTEAKAEPTEAKAEPTEAKAAPKPSDAKQARTKPKKADQAAGAEARRAFKSLLDEGRKAVKADDPILGMQKLEEALTKIPGHPSALGELGWAAYRAGATYFDKAMDATRKALAVSNKNKQKGALWYNLGRVAEDSGNVSLAIGSYRESLAYRPGNPTVQKQLEAVLAKVGGKSGSDGLEKLDDVCMELRIEQGCMTAASAEGLIAHSCDCGTEILGPEEGFGRAALMRVTGSSEASGAVDSTYLLVEVGARWHLVTMVGNDWSPGMNGISNSSTKVAFEFKSIGGKPTLWVLFENDMVDTDLGDYTIYLDWSRTLTVCALADNKPACLGIPLGRGQATDMLVFEGEPLPDDKPPVEVKNVRWSFTANPSDTAITIALEAGAEHLDDDNKSLPGTWTFEQLMTVPGVVPHAL